MKETFEDKYAGLEQKAEQVKPLLSAHYKKNKKKIEKMDTLVHQLHEKYSMKVNCLECARCCKSLGPAIYDKDIERISKVLRMKPSDMVDKYLKIDEDGDYVFRSMPCPFLLPDNYCMIYEARPKACREYPHTDRKRFSQIFNLSIKNTSTCPIVYGVMTELINK
ncbi:MAG: YkgJ family cysteine cluster protein [Dysgonomonas sp.]